MKKNKLEGLLVYINHKSKIALIKTDEGNFFCDFNSNPVLLKLETFPNLKVTLDLNRQQAVINQSTKIPKEISNFRTLKLVEVA